MRRRSLSVARPGLRAALVFSTLGLSSISVDALATEPRKATEPRIMAEPGEVTNVVDAFDTEHGNPFDLHLTLGFQQTWGGGKIRRETALSQPGLSTGRFTSDTMNVATYKESTARLNTRLDVGVYKDIALYLRMPLILSRSQELSDLDGSEKNQATVLAGAYDPVTGSREQLFRLPFKSPTRSGIEYLALGFDLGIFNQARDSTKPTWVFGFEGRFPWLSSPMHACGSTMGLNQKSPQVECAHQADVDRDGNGGVVVGPDGAPLEGRSVAARKPGVGRGTTALEIHSIMSRRVKYVEPYGGFRAVIEFPQSDSDYGEVKGADGILTAGPPLQGWMIVGVQIIPWEVKEQFQRLTFDLRFTGSYRSEGRDYSPLYDALGSSDARTVRYPGYSGYRLGTGVDGQPTSVVNPGSQRVYVTGLTDVAAHGSFQLSGSVLFQAGEYIKFQVGLGYTHVQGHLITGDQPCNPNFKDDVSKSGPCKSTSTTTSGGSTKSSNSATGIPNPLYRPAYDAVGSRFKIDDMSLWDGWINAIVMF